jgi:hypothetical protein
MKTHIIRQFDIFTKPVNLNILEDDKHRTPFGLLLTFLLFVFSITSVVYLGIELYERKNPQVI